MQQNIIRGFSSVKAKLAFVPLIGTSASEGGESTEPVYRFVHPRKS